MAMGRKSFVNICKNGTLEEVREALANGADVNKRNKGRDTNLMVAVNDVNEPLVSLLLQQPGIQVNAKNGGAGCTALHYAAYYCHGTKGRKLIKLLLNFPGIDTKITTDDGKTPLLIVKKKEIQKSI